MFPFLLALLFILKIRLGNQSNILEFIKKRYGNFSGRMPIALARNYSEHMNSPRQSMMNSSRNKAGRARNYCFGETFY